MLLFLHTNPVDENGTDIPEVVRMNVKHGHVKFSEDKLPTEGLNLFYNSCDVVLNVASNEGFGLGSCEATKSRYSCCSKCYRWTTRPMWIQIRW